MVMDAWELAVNAVVLASSYALVAVGLTLVYGILQIVNFAHGELVMTGAFAALAALTATGSFLVAVLAGVVGGALVSVLVDRVAFRPLRSRDPLMPLVGSLGVSIMLVSLAQLLSGADARPLHADALNRTIDIGFPISLARVLIVIVSVTLIGALYWFVTNSFHGKALRAVAQQRTAAELMGIDTESVFRTTFIIAGALAGIAGALLGPTLLVFPQMGTAIVLKAFAIIIVGGFGNLNGAVLGALAVGLLESLTAEVFAPQWTDTVTFVFIGILLIVRPTGLVRERLAENV